MDDILDNLGLKEKVEEGEIQCECCERKLTIKNIGGIYIKGGKTHLICDSLKCIAKVEG